MVDGLKKEIPQPVSAEVVLRDAATRYRRLNNEAEEALYVHKDADEYQKKLIESGQVIAGLTQSLGQALVDKSALSEIDRDELEFFSSGASAFLESNNLFALGVLLIPRGSRVGDLNYLEKLIERVYPTTPDID